MQGETARAAAGGRGVRPPAAALAAALFGFSWLLLADLGRPLLWNDEGDTAVFAQRVLDYGYPKAHGEPPFLYNLQPERIDPETDAYRGGLWGYYYFGAIGAALASGVDDLEARTARLRAPFALAGWLGVVGLGAALLPAVGRGRARALLFVAAYLLLAASSTSLILHLRQARWYGPALLLLAAALWVFARSFAQERAPRPSQVALLAALLFALFNVFYPAAAILGGALALAFCFRAATAPGSRAERLRRLARDGLPLALAALAALPVAVHFDLLGFSQGWLGDLAASGRSHAENLRFALHGLLRYELLAPAALGRLLVWATDRAPESGETTLATRGRIASWLLLFVALYVAAVTRSPLVWERYFIVLSPCLAALLALDGLTLWERARSADARGRVTARAAAATLAACTLASLAVRAPELAGRIAEIRTPVEGPLDRIIPHLRDHLAPTERLVIATNYEGPVLSWYLGSHVVLGYYGGNLEDDRRLPPDVLIWRPWPRRQDDLARWLRAGPGEQAPRWERVGFAVRNTRTNNMPSLWPDSPGGVRHRFATQLASGPADEAAILVRARD